MIAALIDKQDNFEIVRDKIASILALEVASQKALATAGGKDPALWDIKVYTERSNPWEQYLNENPTPTPIVNVWYDNSSFTASGSNISERQQTEAVFNIDCYGYGAAAATVTGHNPGDEEAAFAVQRTIRLVRNILMASEYTYLGLRGLVWKRWPQSVSIFQPEQSSHTVQQIVAARIALQVVFNEFSPQYPENMLEYVSTTVKRAEDGQIIVVADFDYTTP